MSGNLTRHDGVISSLPKLRILGSRQQDLACFRDKESFVSCRMAETSGVTMFLQVHKRGRVEDEQLMGLLKMPTALAGRLAVAEASLQRLHGSPDAQQPGRAGAGAGAAAGAAQQPTATHTAEAPSIIQRRAEKVRQERSTARVSTPATSELGREQHGATACRCAVTEGASAGEQCLIAPFLGTGSAHIGLWLGCFRALLRNTCARQESQHWEEQGSVSSAQQCSALAQELRMVVSGLPVSNLGAAAGAMTAFMAAEIVCRESSHEVSPRPQIFYC